MLVLLCLEQGFSLLNTFEFYQFAERMHGERKFILFFLSVGKPKCPLGKLGWLCKLFGKPLV
jgi:hypothetical protein